MDSWTAGLPEHEHHPLRGTLEAGLAELGLPLEAGAVPRLLDYLELLQRWNRAYNLTAVREPADMVGRHLLDSLSILPFLRGTRLLDVGSGAGLPGIPLAIARPGAAVTLLDSNGKKTRFLVQAAAELGLDNVEVVQRRAEDWHPPQGFDTVVCRAFAALPEIAALCAHLLAPQGQLLAMKGSLPRQELSRLPKRFNVLGCEALRVPGVAGERHLVILSARS